MYIKLNITITFQVQALETDLQNSRQAQHRQDADNQHAMAGLQAQLKQAGREVEVLKAGAGHAQEQALAALKVSFVPTLTNFDTPHDDARARLFAGLGFQQYGLLFVDWHTSCWM